MPETRRTWLKSSVALASLGLAGCSMFGGDEPAPEEATETERPSEDGGSESAAEPEAQPGTVDAVDAAIAAEWNAIRTRLRDPVILGHAEGFAVGAGVAADIFERFEAASGEHNAHETLEETSESNYEGLWTLRTALENEDLDGAHDAMRTADRHLREAQGALVGSGSVRPLTLLVMGAHVEDGAMLALVGDFEDAAESMTDALEWAATAAEDRDPEGSVSAAAEAFEAVTAGSYALLPETIAGATHLAGLQARGWDAAALASLGGPSTEFAHAAALNIYRARVRDAAWLFERGHGDTARQRVGTVLAHFEGARAHEALKQADEGAYRQVEHEGLGALVTAIESDDDEGVASAAETVDGALVSGIEALGSGDEPALLEAGYFKARIEDAVERYRLGEGAVAAETARGLFETFEANEADFHETLEETDESLYEAFEEEHLSGLIAAFENSDDAAVDDHAAGIRETLLDFETAAGSTAQVSAVESGYLAARVFDAGVLDTVGEGDRAASLVRAGFQHFETGAGGFHEALEEADHDRYEAFEEALAEAGRAAREGGAVTERARAFNGEAVGAVYAVVASAGGSGTGAVSTVQSTFAHFEDARVHELLEEADREAYEGFETALEEYIGALDSRAEADAAAERFGRAALRAQFAVAGAPGAAPEVGTAPEDDSGEQADLEGGPDVVAGVPDDADHVVDMQAVAFELEALTVEQGETVAWAHAAGEPHSVSAYEDRIPGDATY